MSIASEINRLQAAKAAIELAIASKGVEIPAGALLDEMAPLIAAIEAGGGSGGDIDSLADRTIKEYSSTLVKKIGDYAFRGCVALTAVNLPEVTSVGTYAFYGCNKLTTVNLPQVTSTGSYAFYGCSELTAVNLPRVTTMSNYAFQNCSALTTADLPALRSIGTFFFSACTKLTTIVLRSSALCTLSNTNALSNTPFRKSGSGGTVYVPAALVESYKVAANWSTLYDAGTCNFVAIEGSEYE